jgi:hypothetical protein
MLFDFDINHYTYEDLKKLFNMKEGESLSSDEIDMRISNIKYSAESSTKDKNELLAISNFLIIAKEKFMIYENNNKIQYNNVYPMTERLKKEFKPNTFLDKSEHAIIEHRSDINIPTDLKYVNICSSDRDEVAWPLSSYFEIALPDSLKDVTYLTLYDFNFYCHVFNFTKFYQNTKFSFSVDSTDSNIAGNYNDLSIEDGYYTEDQLLQAICDEMNTATSGSGFNYYINPTRKRVSIYNDSQAYKTSVNYFTLKFGKRESYENNKWQMRNIYDLDTSWGMGYFLGFDKEDAVADSNFEYIDENGNTQTALGVTAPRIMNIILNHNVFLEIDGFNHVLQTRRETGVVNSYFSRIPLLNGFANDVGGFERANISMEKVSKLKLRLRFHNGILLDLQNQNFDLTLLFGCKK